MWCIALALLQWWSGRPGVTLARRLASAILVPVHEELVPRCPLAGPVVRPAKSLACLDCHCRTVSAHVATLLIGRLAIAHPLQGQRRCGIATRHSQTTWLWLALGRMS